VCVYNGCCGLQMWSGGHQIRGACVLSVSDAMHWRRWRAEHPPRINTGALCSDCLLAAVGGSMARGGCAAAVDGWVDQQRGAASRQQPGGAGIQTVSGKWARSNERSSNQTTRPPPDSRQAESSSSKRRIHFIHSLAYLIREHALLDWGGPSTPGQPVPVGLDRCHGPFWPGSCLIDRMIKRGRGRRILFVMCTCGTSTRCPHSPIDPSHTHS